MYNLPEHPDEIMRWMELGADPVIDAWLNWVHVVERRVGHSLDGDQAIDGYSLDHAYEAYKAGEYAIDYARRIGRRKK